VVGQTASVGILRKSDESRFSPGGIPRVLNNVILISVTNDQDGVVQLRGSVASIEDTA